MKADMGPGDRFKDTCKASAKAQVACKAAEAATTGLTGQKAGSSSARLHDYFWLIKMLADAWNNALGLAGKPDLTNAATDSSTAVTSAASSTSSIAVLKAACPSHSNSSKATTSASANLDLGSCSNPTIHFGAGLDGRTDESFEPADKGDFNHGSADNIDVITSFICQQLADKCKANQAALTVCSKASSAAAQQSGQAAADAFSNVFVGNNGSVSAAASSMSQAAVTSSDPGASAATATSSAESNASTSVSNDRKPNGQRKGENGGNRGGNSGDHGNKGPSSTDAGATNASSTDSMLSLLASNLQSASDATGVHAQGAEKAQAASATDPANFNNFCSGKTLTNGLQVKSGSCNGIVMGDIPSTANMVSQIITFPEIGKTSKLKANQTFKIKVQTANLNAGSFTNPDTT